VLLPRAEDADRQMPCLADVIREPGGGANVQLQVGPAIILEPTTCPALVVLPEPFAPQVS
jgi:hypothetical protein